MIGAISNIVSQLTANGDTFTFEYGKRGYINVLEDNLLLPAIIYDTESIFNLNPIQSGFIGESGRPILSFMYKSELDWTPQQHYTNCILPAIAAARQFISLCQDSNLIDEISVGDGKEFINLLDKNTSGIQIPFTIKLNVDKTVCVAATPSTNCQPVILTINGVSAETILSGAAFALNVTLNGTPSGTYNELTQTWEVVGGNGVCADATVNVNGNLYDTVASGGTLDVLVQYEDTTPVGTIVGNIVEIPNPITCADATYTIKNTALAILYSGAIPSGGDLQQTIQNSTITIKDQDKNILYDSFVIAEGLFNQGIENSTVTNSDLSYSTAILAEGSLILPDTTYNIYVNNVLDQSLTVPTLKDETINIIP